MMNPVKFLPSDCKVGQGVTLANTSGQYRGCIVSIPAHRRFALVESTFDSKGIFGTAVSVRQLTCLPIRPPKEQLCSSVPALRLHDPHHTPPIALPQSRSGTVHQHAAMGMRFNRLRTARHLSQRAIAAECGIGTNNISRWELGYEKVPRKHYPALARLFALSEEACAAEIEGR